MKAWSLHEFWITASQFWDNQTYKFNMNIYKLSEQKKKKNWDKSQDY